MRCDTMSLGYLILLCVCMVLLARRMHAAAYFLAKRVSALRIILRRFRIPGSVGNGIIVKRIDPASWSSGWKEWDIPIGWGDRIDEVKGRSRPNSQDEFK